MSGTFLAAAAVRRADAAARRAGGEAAHGPDYLAFDEFEVLLVYAGAGEWWLVTRWCLVGREVEPICILHVQRAIRSQYSCLSMT